MESDGEKSEKMASDFKGSSKISFSLPSKSSAKPKAKPSEDKESHEEEDRPEFVNEFDPTKPTKKVKVIPKLENSWRPEKKMKNIQMKDSELQFEPEADVKNSDDSNVEYGLNLRTHVAVSMEVDQNGEEGFKGIVQNEKTDNSGVLGFMSSGEAEIKRLRESIDELPEEASLEAYSSLPVEDFGAALLRGMGWSEEKGIGRAKEPVMPIEYVRRAGREGLGATPAPSVEKPKRFVKPGESREGRRRDLVAAPGPDGRVRNVVNVGEKLVERQRKGVALGKIMFIAEGRHVGLRGEVIEVLGEGSDVKRVVMRLSKSEEKVVVRVGDVVDVGSVEEVDCLKRLKEMRVDGRGNSRDGRVQKGYEDAENGAVRSRDRDSGSRDEKHNRREENYGSKDEKHNRREEDYGSRDDKHNKREENYGSRDEKKLDEIGRGECERDYRFRDERRESRGREQRKSGNDDIRDGKKHDKRREDWDRQSRQLDVYRDKGHQVDKGNWKGDGRRDDYRDRKEDARREDYRDRKEDAMQDKYPDRKENARRQNYYDREEAKNRRGEEERRESRDKSNRNEGTINMEERQANEDRRKTEFENKANEKSRSKNGIPESVLRFSWLTSQIRVRVISKDFQGGKLYLKKGRVIDVVDPTTCDLLMDENAVVVQGVKQDVLETALPKRGGLVMVVEGKHRGIVGKLLERDSDKGVGLVRKEDTYETLTLSLDHIAEFVGEPEELGY